MKKQGIIILSIFLLAVLTIVGCNPFQSNNDKQVCSLDEDIKTGYSYPNYKLYEDEAELFNDADLVVVAKTDICFEDREHIVEYYSSPESDLPEAMVDYYTLTPIIISEVVKSPPAFDIKKNKQISIIEPLSIITNKDGSKYKRIPYQYVELEKGIEYVLYLRENPDGEYYIGDFNTRFTLEIDEIINYGELGEDTEFEHMNVVHTDMKRAVKARLGGILD
ncbi:hypothetical protein [Bacillus alkalicellulosilyticus]|uniref:hypothetical protein n=1 Tax=Alkalihalobacterium alkalicellulosilyticum TaxID=1912214 RepID=UPI000998E6E8|nr:hypothetical protein [Bacillus alkalicellulosilyticus]